MSDSEATITTRGEGISGDRIESVCVDALAYRNSAQNFAGIPVHEGHEFVVAAHHEDFVNSVNGQAGGRFARREGPGVFDSESIGVESDERAFVFEIHEYFALAVRRSELWAPAKRESADDFSGLTVNGRGGVGVTIECE